MQSKDSQDTPSSGPSGGSSPPKVVADTGPVSSKAAKLLGFDSSSGPANKSKAARNDTRSQRSHPPQFRPARADLEASHPIKNPNNPASTNQSGGGLEEIFRKLLSRKRNVVIVLVFLFSIVVAVSVVSGLQGKGSSSESTQSSGQPPQTSPSNSSNSHNSSLLHVVASPSANKSVGMSQGGVGGGQSPSLKRRMAVSQTYQGIAPTSMPF